MNKGYVLCYYNLIWISQLMNTQSLPCLLLLLVLTTSHSHRCHFDQLHSDLTSRPQGKPDEVLHPSKGRLLVPNPVRAPIRIELDTTMFNDPIISGLNGAATTTTTNLNFILKTIQIAKTFYESRLQVGTMATIYAPPDCVGYTPSTTAQGSGYANADLVIFVHYLSDATITYGATGKSCKYVTGTATTMSPDSTLTVGRPTFGRIIFNTYNLVDRVSALTNRLFQSITSTVLHETMHILGFDSTLYATYLDPAVGAPYSLGTTIAGIVNANRPNTTFLKTPYVLAWAKDFFGCSSLTGMPLQNQDSTGLGGGSHWQRVAMYDQMMTATSLGSAKYFSGLTFAMLKDMGWYSVDNRFAGTSGFGYQKGCSFVTQACYGTSFSEFCSVTALANNSYCDSNYLGKAICTDTAAMMSDSCGMFGQYFSCIDPNSQDSSYQTYTYEAYSTSSFCVDSSFGSVTLPSNLLSRCYSYTCTSTSIVFTIGSYSVTCLSSETGVTKTLSALSGSLKCPDFTSFCTMSGKTCSNFCNQNGFCMGGVCHCNQGYYGHACTITSCSSGQYYNPSSSSCLTQCNTGYYANPFSRSCQPCQSPCSECSGLPTNCVGCQPISGVTQYFYINACYAACPSGTYALVNATCLACDINCKTCITVATTCTSCESPNFLSQPSSGTCVATCTGGYTLYDNVNRVCVSTCPSNLLTTGLNCDYCPIGTYKDSTSCVSNCTSGYYADDTTHACLTCDSTCLSCDGSFPQNCTSCKTTGGLNYLLHKMCWAICPKGFYANPSTYKCQVCPVELHCTACTFNSSNSSAYCTICEYGTYFQNTYQTCESSCLSTQYKNSWNNSCNPCDAGCATCNGPTSYSCKSCQNTFYLLSNSTGGYCLAACPTIGYIQIGTQCQPCDPTCSSCNGVDPNNCFNCTANYYLSSGYCRYVCPNATYPDATSRQCLPCDSSCAYCFGSSINSCTSCSSGLYLYNFTCSGSCPNGLTPNQWNVCFESHFPLAILALFLLLAAAAL